MRKSSSKRSVKISQRRNRKTCANRHSSTCSITDLFRFQDQLEFTFGIVYLIACVINFNFDMIVKCCPHSASINVDDLNTFRSSLSIFCKQFWAKYKRMSTLFHLFFFGAAHISFFSTRKVVMSIGLRLMMDLNLMTRCQPIKSGFSLYRHFPIGKHLNFFIFCVRTIKELFLCI